MEIFLTVPLLTNYSFMQGNFVCQCFYMQARKTDFEDPNICDQKYSNIVIKNIEHEKHFNWWPLATCKEICRHSMAASLTFEANTLISPILNFRLGTVWKVEVVGRFLGKCRRFDLIDSIYFFLGGRGKLLVFLLSTIKRLYK